MYDGIIKYSLQAGDIRINVQALAEKKESLFKYENREKFAGLCKNGCSNFNKNWSCPPFSPSYREFAEDYEYVLIALYYCGLSQFGHIGRDDEIISHSHVFLKSQIDKLMYSLETVYDGVSILNGHCSLCGECLCESGQACRNPQKMRYSMESMGLDVEGISSEFFGHKILWYENNQLPEYSTILSCLLTNVRPDENSICSAVKL